MPEGLQLNDDGTATATWDDHTVSVRRPKLREYRSFVEEQERANASLLDGKADDAFVADSELIGTDEAPGPYLVLWSRLLGELGGQSIAPQDLALWMMNATTFNQLVSHWRTNPLARGAALTT